MTPVSALLGSGRRRRKSGGRWRAAFVVVTVIGVLSAGLPVASGQARPPQLPPVGVDQPDTPPAQPSPPGRESPLSYPAERGERAAELGVPPTRPESLRPGLTPTVGTQVVPPGCSVVRFADGVPVQLDVGRRGEHVNAPEGDAACERPGGQDRSVRAEVLAPVDAARDVTVRGGRVARCAPRWRAVEYAGRCGW